MKIIKTIIPLILLFVSSFAFGQIVNIPDANLKAALLAADYSNNTASISDYNYDVSGYYFEGYKIDL